MGNPMIGAEDKGLFGTLIVNPASGKVPALIDGKVVDVDIADIKREFILWMHETTFWGQELNHIVKGDKALPQVLSHGRYVTFQMAGVISRCLFADILRLIAAKRAREQLGNLFYPHLFADILRLIAAKRAREQLGNLFYPTLLVRQAQPVK